MTNKPAATGPGPWTDLPPGPAARPLTGAPGTAPGSRTPPEPMPGRRYQQPIARQALQLARAAGAAGGHPTRSTVVQRGPRKGPDGLNDVARPGRHRRHASRHGCWSGGALGAARVTSRGQADLEEQKARRQAYSVCATALLARRDAVVALLETFPEDVFDQAAAQVQSQNLDEQRAAVARAVGAVAVEGPYAVAHSAEYAPTQSRFWPDGSATGLPPSSAAKTVRSWSRVRCDRGPGPLGPVGRALPRRQRGSQPAQIPAAPQGPHGRPHPGAAARSARPGTHRRPAARRCSGPAGRRPRHAGRAECCGTTSRPSSGRESRTTCAAWQSAISLRSTCD